MCTTIYINRGEKEIGTPRQFMTHFGFLPTSSPQNVTMEEMDECLCGFDIEEAFKRKKIEYKIDMGDYFVGQLDLVKGDNERLWEY